MQLKSVLIFAVLIGALLLAAAIPLRAAYTADIGDQVYYILVLAIIEDPDPVPWPTPYGNP